MEARPSGLIRTSRLPAGHHRHNAKQQLTKPAESCKNHSPASHRLRSVKASTGASVPSSRNMAWVIVWLGLGLAVGLCVAASQGRSAATEYFAAYLLEE